MIIGVGVGVGGVGGPTRHGMWHVEWDLRFREY